MKKKKPIYETDDYWRRRSHLLYYQYFRRFIELIGDDAKSIIDVGSGNSPYLEWFSWIPEKVSIDLKFPYQSENVRGIQGNIFDVKFETPFDICTCMQVLEHVPDPAPFAKRLLELSNLLLVSVPYKWPKGLCKYHVNDPVDLNSLISWFGRKPNYHLVVREPLHKHANSGRLFAIFDPLNPERRIKPKTRKKASSAKNAENPQPVPASSTEDSD